MYRGRLIFGFLNGFLNGGAIQRIAQPTKAFAVRPGPLTALSNLPRAALPRNDKSPSSLPVMGSWGGGGGSAAKLAVGAGELFEGRHLVGWFQGKQGNRHLCPVSFPLRPLVATVWAETKHTVRRYSVHTARALKDNPKTYFQFKHSREGDP